MMEEEQDQSLERIKEAIKDDGPLNSPRSSAPINLQRVLLLIINQYNYYKLIIIKFERQQYSILT